MAGPEDNILGGQDAVIRVGVEADMGDILEQATKFNELIKDANDSFNVMQTVITNTTNRMASLQSATLRLVSSARQLRNEYELIADSTQRIAPMGGGYGGYGMAPAVAGIGGGNMTAMASGGGIPGWASSAMPTPIMTSSGMIIPGGAMGSSGMSVPRTSRISSGEVNENIGQVATSSSKGIIGGAFRAAQLYGMYKMGTRLTGLGQYRTTGELFRESWGNPVSFLASIYGRRRARMGKTETDVSERLEYLRRTGQLPPQTVEEAAAEATQSVYQTAQAPGGLGQGVLLGEEAADVAGALSGAGEVATGAEAIAAGAAGGGGLMGTALKAIGATGLLGKGKAALTAAGVGGASSSLPLAVPVIGAIIGTIAAAYKATDWAFKGATRYSGMTGGTGITSSPAGYRGSFIGLQQAAWMSGLANMAVGPGGYTEIQEGLLNAGVMPYTDEEAEQRGINGLRYDSSRRTLAYLYQAGFKDVGANIENMNMAINNMGGATSAFRGAMDFLRVAAQRTGAELQAMTKAFGASLRNVSNMGGYGNWATFYSTSAATAYSNARNEILRNGGGVADLSTINAQIQLVNTPAFMQAGIDLNNRYMAYNNGPGMATVLARGQDQSVDQMLAAVGLGGLRNMSYEEANRIIRSNSISVDALRQSPMIQALVGPEVLNNTDAFLDWLVTNATGDPNAARLTEMKRDAGAKFINDFSSTRNYMNDTLDQLSSGIGKNVDAFLEGGITESDLAKYPILYRYGQYINKTQNSIGWLNSLLTGGDADNTYVMWNNEKMKLSKFMREYGGQSDAIRAMESGELKVAVSTTGKAPTSMSDFSEAYNLGTTEKSMKDATLNEFKQTFKEGMTAWADDNNKKGAGHLKVEATGLIG